MRPLGSNKTLGSGRRKGTPNTDTLPLEKKAKQLKVDPFEILLHFAKGDWDALGYPSPTRLIVTKSGAKFEVDVITPEHRLKAASEACQYLHPKRKAIQVEEPFDPNRNRPLKDLSDEELDQL